MLNIFSGVFYVLSAAPFMSFIAKYLEVQFNTSAGGGTLITGEIYIVLCHFSVLFITYSMCFYDNFLRSTHVDGYGAWFYNLWNCNRQIQTFAKTSSVLECRGWNGLHYRANFVHVHKLQE